MIELAFKHREKMVQLNCDHRKFEGSDIIKLIEAFNSTYNCGGWSVIQDTTSLFINDLSFVYKIY